LGLIGAARLRGIYGFDSRFGRTGSFRQDVSVERGLCTTLAPAATTQKAAAASSHASDAAERI
jgi:hypothetical protein